MLRAQGVRSRYGVDIPYFDERGRLLGTKTRTRLVAKEGSYWEAGKPLVPYGLNHLGEARGGGGTLLIPEGESDLWTLRFHGFDGLGIPGAAAARCVERAHLEGFTDIFVFVEPDKGGASFLPGLVARLEEIGYDGRLYAVRMPEHVKDLSALHVSKPDGGAFRTALSELLTHAEDVSLRRTPAVELPEPLAPRTTVAPETAPERKLSHSIAAESASEVEAVPSAPVPLPTLRPEQWDEVPKPRRVPGKKPLRNRESEKPEPADGREKAASSEPSAARRTSRFVDSVRQTLASGLEGLRSFARRRARAVLGVVDPDRTRRDPVPEAPARHGAPQATIVGSEKQVAWAESLRAEFGRRIDAHLKPALDATRERAPRERLLRTRRQLYAWLNHKTDARWFIENRELAGAALVARAATEDRTIAKRIEGLAHLNPEVATRGGFRPDEATLTERAKLRRELVTYFDDARSRVRPSLVAHVDLVRRATLSYLERQQSPEFYAAHRSASPKAVLKSIRGDDEQVRERLDAYKQAAAQPESLVALPELMGAPASRRHGRKGTASGHRDGA